jgi:hypothetical protein
MTEDAEIKGMHSMVEILDQVEPEARARMINWVVQRYGVTVRAPNSRAPAETSRDSESKLEFGSLSDLFEAASPKTESQMALVGGFWFQESQGQPDFSSQQVNDELKNLGHRLTNITRAFDFLRQTKPALVLQIQKSGKSKQARKRFRLTQAGVKAVRELIDRPGTENDS